jgi:hypothetical protein
MNVVESVMLIVAYTRGRLAAILEDHDRGDVAEKIVIVGIFVALAVAVGLIITKAVTGDANDIAHQINGQS